MFLVMHTVVLILVSRIELSKLMLQAALWEAIDTDINIVSMVAHTISLLPSLFFMADTIINK